MLLTSRSNTVQLPNALSMIPKISSRSSGHVHAAFSARSRKRVEELCQSSSAPLRAITDSLSMVHMCMKRNSSTVHCDNAYEARPQYACVVKGRATRRGPWEAVAHAVQEGVMVEGALLHD